MFSDSFLHEYGNYRVQELHRQAQDMRTIDAAGKNNARNKNNAAASSMQSAEKDRQRVGTGRRKPAVLRRLASLFSLMSRNIL